MRRRSGARRLLRGGVVLLALMILGIGTIWYWPIETGGLSASSHPITDYATAVARARALDKTATEPLHPLGGTILLTHGHKTPKTIVFLHGYTNNPQQFRELGKRFFALGYNVLIPRQPHHGYQNRMTKEQAKLTAEELTAFTDEVVDIAHGLGDRVTLAGLSGGAMMAGWAAQHRSDLDQVVLIAPIFGVKAIPAAATRPAMNFYRLLLPVSFAWWDPKKREATPPPHAYPRYSPTVIAQLLRLGFAVRESAAGHAPAAKSLLIITNANDKSVDNAATAEVTAAWRRHALDRVRAFEFPADQKLPHDLIDPGEPDQNIALVFPKLIELIDPTPGPLP